MKPDATHILYAEAIRRLGRNAHANEAGVLEPEIAAALWTALLAQRFSAAQEAALLMGLRVHGESAAMLAAFARATPIERITAPAGTIVIGCAGAARKHPSAAPLLALRLAQLNVPVLILTATPDGRGKAAAVLAALGHAVSTTAAAAAQALAATRFSWSALTGLAPELARVIALRAELGFRNSAHTVAKLIDPIDSRTGGGLIAASYTHRPYRATLAAAVADLGLSAWLARGTEGDPVAWEGESHGPLAWVRGAAIELEPATETPRAAPPAIAGDDAATAAWTRRALSGEEAIPTAIERQAQALAALSRRVAS